MSEFSAQEDFFSFKKLGLKLDMSRGKPSPEQLDLSINLLEKIRNYESIDHIDVRNYGESLGLLDARLLFENLLNIPHQQIIIGDNSSLALMHDCIIFSMLYGNPDGRPWIKEPISFLCPVPGYDRHFAICQALGINMINISINKDGPDINEIENLVKTNPNIKGIWCVPKYSNPNGVIYSDEIVRKLANMKTAADDFRIFWDDAYHFHHLTEEKFSLINIMNECLKAGNPNRPIQFTSTSKITLAGAGISVLCSSVENIKWYQKYSNLRSIGPNKVNQLQHVNFLKDKYTVESLMEKHRLILKPKFDMVLSQFTKYLSNINDISWTYPKGGYFIDLKTPKGYAKKTVSLAKELGITLTPAGAAFPYGIDPDDRHIRIAPSYPSLLEIEQAAKGICLSLLVALGTN
ncbi:aminotransferase class I/II-fold pyridoxal phosphate-dependent enzyme [Acinetobacter calcoaceticus]|uniref:aminotransferase class I/II-fold pyridoxal phosphate-dependent enzyme n=1 Tax=Acinetobacter calcoaceticus TaxID=471 RepID=UPI001E4D2C35|nr:aminotransferase class I/II-fold pyridoxal phosphate-dependent enzyme [Acinetobacter calcoaceticus]UGQ25670.1 aminotransferase class I/II-fold pyridoxal phosphate-dependent enzyme [Acinetobacter calcoaceticus]